MSKITSYDVHRWLFEAVKLRSRVDIDPRTIHVSEVVGCLRRAYYYRTKFVQISPANALKLLGDEVHKALQEVLRRHGYEVEFPVALNLEDIRLVGCVDAFHPDKGIALEIKTVSKHPKTPYPNHKRQLEAYITLAHAKKGYLVYITRNDGDVAVFEIHPNKYTLRELVDRARFLSASLINREPPPPERTPLCNHCDFRFLCFKGGERWR